MTATEPVQSLLADLARADIRIRLADDDLEVTAPAGTLSAALRDRIVACKPDLVRWLAGADSGPDHELPVVTANPSAADEPFALSDLQTAFLVGSAEGLEYHVRPHQYMEFDFPDFDVDRFMASVNRNLRRHRDDLVVLTEDIQLRRIETFTPLEARVHDLRGLPAATVEEELTRLRASLRRRQLPIDRWPWFDIQISLRDHGQGRVHWNNNNFFTDGIGASQFLKDIFALYHDPDRRLPELEVSFGDCVRTLAEMERSPLGTAARDYWLERIPHWPDAPPIPLVTSGSQRERSELSRREFVVPAQDWVALTGRARERGLTPTTVMYAAYAQVVSTWSGSRHFLLNNMVTHRLPIHPQIGEVLGNFAALYPLEVDWRAEETFEARARRLRAQVDADVAHTHYSGVKVLQALNQHRRTPGRAACPYVISSGLSMGKFPRPTYSMLETPQVLIDCQFWEQSDGTVWVAWDVIESMFPDGVIDAMHAAFQTVLHELATDESAWLRTRFDLTPDDQLARRAELNASPARATAGLLHDALGFRADSAGDR
ncbi:condensation domain-containing protein, partial [Saccharomonospora saliphila]|uniref:condensation domain-containing protein n=1 Tax=Saccharomonospora saliphila TaxID=369829 RepID=UPI000372CDC2